MRAGYVASADDPLTIIMLAAGRDPLSSSSQPRPPPRARVAAWVDEHNHTRRHSSIGMISPMDYELAHQTDPDTEDLDTEVA